jgi:CheY-like chemotaxis protein
VAEYLRVFPRVGFFLLSVVQNDPNPATESFYARVPGRERRYRVMNRDAVDRMEILLVEDNLENANDTIQALKWGKVQCRVSLVCDGEEAISFLCRKGEFAQAPTPKLILLNMQLPKEEGWHVLEEIRANEELKDIPVVALTGSLDRQTGLYVQELHVDGFMTKPLAWDKFIGVAKSRRRSWLAELVQCSTA